jgi:hypothetical protein
MSPLILATTPGNSVSFFFFETKINYNFFIIFFFLVDE